MGKHTPGPWKAIFTKRRKRDGYPMYSEVLTADGESCIVYADGRLDEDEANFLLIAAAPMLLFRLKQEHGFPCSRECCDVCREIQNIEWGSIGENAKAQGGGAK